MGSVICKSSQTSGKKTSIEQYNAKIDECDGEFVEEVICKETDINENEMKVFELKDDVGKVLVVKQKGVVSALGTKCTHYGAPLVNGALGDGRIRCQWHGACFNITTGDIEDFPGLDSLPCYQVKIDQEKNVRVRAKRSELSSNKRVKTMCVRDVGEARTMVVVGGGPSGACCVETLRQEGFSGRIVLLCKESYLPYDRVKVSKSLDFDIAKAEFRTASFYEEHSIEVIRGTAATSLNTENNSLTLSNGNTLSYDRLYIATGSASRALNIPGADLPQVCTLREYEDSRRMYALLKPETHLVILGLSFIAMEAAAYCVDKVERVTVVGRDTVPFRALLGEAIGAQLLELFREKGVHFELESGLRSCIGTDGKLSSVELSDGRTITAHACLLAVGSTLNTDWLAGSGVRVNANGSIAVNQWMQTNIPNVYAGGDIADAPLLNGGRATIGHYPLAHYHGRIAGLNMVREGSSPLRAVPYFWTQLFGKSIRYAGYAPKYDRVHIVGHLENYSFLAYYFKDDTVVAMASCQRDPIVSRFAEMLAQEKRLSVNTVLNDPNIWDRS